MELYTPVLALAILAAGFAIFSILVSSLTGPKRYNRAKLDSSSAASSRRRSRWAAASSRCATTSPR